MLILKAFYQKPSLFHGVQYIILRVRRNCRQFRVSLPWLRSVHELGLSLK